VIGLTLRLFAAASTRSLLLINLLIAGGFRDDHSLQLSSCAHFFRRRGETESPLFRPVKLLFPFLQKFRFGIFFVFTAPERDKFARSIYNHVFHEMAIENAWEFSFAS
jgi:hypothetical protein